MSEEQAIDMINDIVAVPEEGKNYFGTITKIMEFGAFVRFLGQTEGLVHISQISHNHIATPADALTPGQEVQVKVLEVHPENQRLGLSIKALEEKPATEEKKPSQSRNLASDAPEEETGFTLGEIAGQALKDDNKE